MRKKLLAETENFDFERFSSLTPLIAPLRLPSFFLRNSDGGHILTDSRSSRDSVIRSAAVASQVISIALEMVFPPLGGFWLDQRWGLTPWLLILGLVLGLLTAGYHGTALMKRLDRESRRSK